MENRALSSECEGLFRKAIETSIDDCVTSERQREKLYYTLANNNRSQRLLSDPSDAKRFILATERGDTASHGVHGVQIRVHPQQSAFLYGPACGYYAAHNALAAIAACCAADEGTACEWLAETQSPASFLRFTSQARALFLERAERSRDEGDKSQLWNAENILGSYEMHRAHMQHLIQALPVFHALGGAQTLTALPSISQLEMKSGIMTLAECDKLQTVLGAFVKKQTHVHGLMIGTGTHWLSLVINKVLGRTEIIILESYNTPLLNTSNEELFDYVQCTVRAHIPDYIKRLQHRKGFQVRYSEAQLRKFVMTGHGRNQWDPLYVSSLEEKANSWFRSLCDIRYTLQLVRDCITGKKTARECYMATVVAGVCELFSAKQSKIETVQRKLEKKVELPVMKKARREVANEEEEKVGGERESEDMPPPTLTLQRQVSFIPLELWVNDPGSFFMPREIHNHVLNGVMYDIGYESLGADSAFQLQTFTTRTRTNLNAYERRLRQSRREGSDGSGSDGKQQHAATTCRSFEYQQGMLQEMRTLCEALDVFAVKSHR